METLPSKSSLKVMCARRTNRPGVAGFPHSNISMLLMSPLPVERQHNLITARQKYSPTSTHGHCCYSKQRHPQKQPKMEEGRKRGKGQEKKCGNNKWTGGGKFNYRYLAGSASQMNQGIKLLVKQISYISVNDMGVDRKKKETSLKNKNQKKRRNSFKT